MASAAFAVSTYRAPPPRGIPLPGSQRACAGESAAGGFRNEDGTGGVDLDALVKVPSAVAIAALRQAGWDGADLLRVVSANAVFVDQFLTSFAGRGQPPEWGCPMLWGIFHLNSAFGANISCAYYLPCAAGATRSLYAQYGWAAMGRTSAPAIDPRAQAAVDVSIATVDFPTMGDAQEQGSTPQARAGMESGWAYLMRSLAYTAPERAAIALGKAQVGRDRAQGR